MDFGYTKSTLFICLIIIVFCSFLYIKTNNNMCIVPVFFTVLFMPIHVFEYFKLKNKIKKLNEVDKNDNS